MNVKKVTNLLAAARTLHQEHARASLTRSCKGMEWQAVLDAVTAAIHPDDDDVLGRILGFVEETAATPLNDYYSDVPMRVADGKAVWPPLRDDKGEIVFDIHFFVYWLLGLQHGSWSLPERMPREALEAFADRYGCVLVRCEDCLMGLANGRRFSCCPVCGGTNLSFKKLSGNDVDGWDPHWVYTPLPPLRRGARAER